MRKKTNEIRLSYFQVGTIVLVNASFLGQPVGVRAFVYENYDGVGLSGISLITENGVDLGGFSLEEQERYLEYEGDTGKTYIFQNVIQLAIDFPTIIQPLFSSYSKPL